MVFEMGKLKGKEEEILKFRGKVSAYKIAKKYGVSHTAIYNVWKRDTRIGLKLGDIYKEHYDFIYDKGYEQGIIDTLDHVKDTVEQIMWLRRYK